MRVSEARLNRWQCGCVWLHLAGAAVAVGLGLRVAVWVNLAGAALNFVLLTRRGAVDWDGEESETN